MPVTHFWANISKPFLFPLKILDAMVEVPPGIDRVCPEAGHEVAPPRATLE